MKLFVAALGALALALRTSVNAAIDDSLCVYKTAVAQCTPAAICAYQPKSGDSSVAQGCRIRANASKLPQQVHLAYAGATTGTGMTISWATYDKIADSSVWIGLSNTTLSRRTDLTVSTSSYYSEGSYTLYQNHVTVTGLNPNTKYFYKVGSAGDATLTSDISSFKTARASSDATEFDIAILGDMGFGDKGEASADYLNTLNEKLDFVLHVGDISYADDDYLVLSQALAFNYENVYNKWMNSLTPIMNKMPYMVTVGNHEAECHSPACQFSSTKKNALYNYTAYNARFKMPSAETKGAKNMWYSFEYGPLHVTSISSETDYTNAPSNAYVGKTNGNFGNQLAWLEADLIKANANRANVPWVVVSMHRPIYNLGEVDSKGVPTGQSLSVQAAFEALFIKYSVDLVVAGHQHAYFRNYPTANNVAITTGVSADKKTYTNPKAPVYLVTGGAGNVEDNKLSGTNGISWNVLETATYGINTVHVTRTSLAIKYIATDTQQVVDDFVIQKA